MAEDTGQERTEQPTPRRIQLAREKGQVPTSRELNTMLMMLISGASVMFIGPGIVSDFQDMFKRYLNISRENVFDITAMGGKNSDISSQVNTIARLLGSLTEGPSNNGFENFMTA